MNYKRMHDGLGPMLYGLPSIDLSASLSNIHTLQVDLDDYIYILYSVDAKLPLTK